MRPASFASRCLFLATVSLLFAGCESQDTRNLPATVTAGGYVFLDGKPIDGAALVFIPEDPNGYPAQGITNASGYFELQAFEKKKGAVPGKYFVQVSKTVEMKADQAGGQTPASDAEHTAEAKSGVFYRNVLPQKYANMATSGLKAEIPPQGTKEIRLELSSAP